MMASLELARVSEAGVTQEASGMKASTTSWLSAGVANGLFEALRDSCSNTSGMLPSVGENSDRGIPGIEDISCVAVGAEFNCRICEGSV